MKRYVLIFWWVWRSGADTSTHSDVYVDSLTLSACHKKGLQWLARPLDLQRQIAYTCQPGQTAYSLNRGNE